MFIQNLNKKQLVILFDALGLLGENANKANEIGTLLSSFKVGKTREGDVIVDIPQFNSKGKIYTQRNTRDNDKTFANCYSLSDFEIEPLQDNLTEKDLEKVNKKYRKIMAKLFGEEYLDAKTNYNRQKLQERGFGPAPKRTVLFNNEQSSYLARNQAFKTQELENNK